MAPAVTVLVPKATEDVITAPGLSRLNTDVESMPGMASTTRAVVVLDLIGRTVGKLASPLEPPPLVITRSLPTRSEAVQLDPPAGLFMDVVVVPAPAVPLW